MIIHHACLMPSLRLEMVLDCVQTIYLCLNSEEYLFFFDLINRGRAKFRVSYELETESQNGPIKLTKM